MKIFVSHVVTRFSFMDQDGKVTVRTTDGKCLVGTYRVRGGKGKGCEIIQNELEISEDKAMELLDIISTNGTGKWKEEIKT